MGTMIPIDLLHDLIQGLLRRCTLGKLLQELRLITLEGSVTWLSFRVAHLRAACGQLRLDVLLRSLHLPERGIRCGGELARLLSWRRKAPAMGGQS